MRKAKVIKLGEPVNQSERDAIAYLRNHLSDQYTLFTNLELKQGLEFFEIDLIVVSPHCVFVVDIKNWHSSIEIIGDYWYPEKYQPIWSPLKKVRKHAKVLSTLIRDSNHVLREQLGKVHIQAAILMVDVDIKIDDPAHLEEFAITYLDRRCFDFFQSKKLIPDRRYLSIQSYRSQVERAIQGKSRPRSQLPCYRDWQTEEKVSENEDYKEYRAYKTYHKNIRARLRIYTVDPWLEIEVRQRQYELISNAYQALSNLPSHPNILGMKDCFRSDDADTWVLVFDDSPRVALSQLIKADRLSCDRRLEMIQSILDALNHAHKYGIIHRNITPHSILLTKGNQPQLTNFDYARITQRNTTIAEDIKEELETNVAYQAIECYSDPSQASITSDLFSLGLVVYEFLMGKQAFKTPEEVLNCEAKFPDRPSQKYPELSSEFDEWLQKLCAFEPKNRFQTCEEAQKAFNTALNTKSLPDRPPLDLANLQPDSILDNRYTIIKRLGNPGSFAVAYHAIDAFGNEPIVLKLVIRDRHSVYQRLIQEYQVLRKIPPHPHIVKVISASQLKDDDETPFITFEYVEGEDLRKIIENRSFSPVETLKIARETLDGLNHLHQNKIYHCDIKPSNLILTAKGVRIIDFNVALSGDRTAEVNAGTHSYLPPDFKANSHHTSTAKIDRDLYALGVTLYECLTGQYPFANSLPSLDKLPPDIRQFDTCLDLTEEWNNFLKKSLSPLRRDRFSSTTEMLQAIASLENPQLEPKPVEIVLDHQLLETLNVILDPIGLYPIESDYIAIATEREWLQKLTGQPGNYWIQGKRLCDWTEAWLQGRDLLHVISQVLQSPSDRLKNLFDPLSLPSDWTEADYFQLLTDLNHYPDPPIPYYLAALSNSDPKIWLDEPSQENLAEWLSVQVPETNKILERVWQKQRPFSPLTSYYQTTNKRELLSQWLGILTPKITDLGPFPQNIPDIIIDDFDRYWEQQIYLTEGNILDTFIPSQQVGMERIANIAYRVFKQRSQWYNKVREKKLVGNLSHSQLTELHDFYSLTQPQRLPLESSPEAVLNWVTKEYLPFRRWEIQKQHNKKQHNEISDRLADSFMTWIVEHYPQLMSTPVADSLLNYQVTNFVSQLGQKSPILWVVVDGLGWLDHLELLDYLTRDRQLSIKTSPEPRFSILPTKTEYTKWSLYQQTPPDRHNWNENLNLAFKHLNFGERYSDRNLSQLYKDLQQQKQSVYCWDTTELDRVYHNQRDWQSLERLERPSCLEKIAKTIHYCLQQYPEPDHLQIVISSDRGKLMGKSSHLTPIPPNLNPLTDTSQQETIVSHGKLFPEEVVIGFSVLQKQVRRISPQIACFGKGKPRTTGELTITINNPNSVPLTHLCLYISELSDYQHGYNINETISPQDKITLNLPIQQCPELLPHHRDRQFSLTGTLSFCYPDNKLEEIAIDPPSHLKIEQIYSSGLDIDEFL